MKAKESEAAKGAEFRASHGWFDRFKRRSNLHDIKVQGEATAAENFLRDLVKTIDDGGYTKDEILNVGVLEEDTIKRTFVSKEKKTMPGFKPAKDRLKLKPVLFYHSKTPGAGKTVLKLDFQCLRDLMRKPG
jgi:hypothetical protein